MLQVISAVGDTVRKAEKQKCWEGSVTVEREEKMGDVEESASLTHRLQRRTPKRMPSGDNN